MSSGLVKENTKLKIGRRKETKIRAEIIEIETKKIIKKINKTKSCFFFNDTATTEIYTLSLHDALPIW